jgi:diguanylate cyclase (GGDEF)-like protein/PAS domain S-box-containing protein
VATLAAVAVVYFVAGKLGLTLAFAHPSATPVWPPAGIALAAFLLLGSRVWPAILAGAFLVNVTTAGSVLTSLGIAAGNTLEGLAGAWLVERFAGGRRPFDSPATAFKFAGLSGAATTVSATFGVTSLALGGYAGWEHFESIWFTWWLGDLGGDLVVAPVLLLWATTPRPRWERPRALEAALLFSSLTLVALVNFSGLFPPGRSTDPLMFLVLPLLVWAAFRFSQREAATATALLSGIAIWGTLQGFGPFVTGSPNESLLLLQAFMAVTGVTTLAVSATVASQHRAEEALARSAAIVDSSEDAILAKTLDGVVTSWNAGARRLYGYTAEEIVGQPVSLLMPADRADEMAELLERIRRGESVEAYETVRMRKDGSPIVVSLAISPIRDQAGDVVGASTIARDVTEQKHAERRLGTQFGVTRVLAESAGLNDAAPRLLRVLCEGLEWDTAELWLVENETALRREGRWPSSAPSIDLTDLAVRAWESRRQLWLDDVGTNGDVSRRGAAAAWPLRNGKEIAGVLVFARRGVRQESRELTDIMDDVGSRVGQFIERAAAFQGLTRLEKAVETLEMGVTITDMGGRILYTNPAEAAMHGYSVEELIGKHVSIFMPQDWRPASDQPGRLRGWRRETVNLRRDGTIFPVQLLSDAVAGPDGRPIGIVTCCEEISERKRAEEVLRDSEERHRLLFERNLAGVYRATLKGRLLECNEAFARILGYASPDEVLARTAWDLFFSSRDRQSCLTRLKEKGTLTNFELRMRKKDGTGVWVLENETLLAHDGEGLVVGTLIDITERKLAEEQIEFHAYHDALTGLPNRTFLMDRLSLALAQARRDSRGLVVMFLDLDRFKEVNDTLGHSVGDWLLQRVAGRLKECVREDDTVSRVGGDEFVLLLPHVRHEEGAIRIAGKILARMEEPFQFDGQELHVTTSAGIALFPKDGEDGEALLKNADVAMYRAKELGRNAYQFCEPTAGA